MVQVLSKLSPITVSCQHYVHPWTESCTQATCGLFLWALGDSLRIYTTVYVLALLMKGKIPSLERFKKTAKGICQSTAFLSFTAFGYSAFLCLIRRYVGNFNLLTVSAIPVFLSSIFAILIERPSRRGLLALYVSNVATETVWNMLLDRKMVKSVRNGQVYIFAASIALLLTYLKAGYHKSETNTEPDSMFKILKFIIGPYEEKDYGSRAQQDIIFRQQEQNISGDRWPTSTRRKQNVLYHLVMQALRVYKKVVNQIKCCDRHNACPHPFSCIYYALQGGTKMFSLGIALQFGLQVILNVKTIFTAPQKFPSILFRRKNLNIAMFLGGSCGLFRSTMCLLRHLTGKDSASHAIPAGLLAGLAFFKYPDTTIALYVFWKMLQITYNLGIDAGCVPNVPGFIMFLYCFSTAILFHAALVEPMNLRMSYWKFLHSISGGRVAMMGRKPMDVWGMNTSEMLASVLKKTRTKPVISYYIVK